MFKKINWKYTVASAFIAAVLFCICAVVYIRIADYTASWILYVGSLLFFFTMAVITVRRHTKTGVSENKLERAFASLLTSVTRIIISVIFCFILLLIMDNGFLLPEHATKILQDAPPATIQSTNGGLVFKVFFATTVLCLFGGSIAGVTLPFYTNSKSDKTDG